MSDKQQRYVEQFFTTTADEDLLDLSTHDWSTDPTIPANPANYDIPLLVQKHPLTPLVNNATPEVLDQVLTEATNNPALYSKEVADYIRQLGMANLWFLTTVILAHNGPFDLVNDHLHMDMCNFRQSKYWTSPGTRAAAFIPRSHLKSTIFTIAGTIWDLLRNPDERHLVVNATKEKAVEFLTSIKQPFENNDLFQSLYPEYVYSNYDTVDRPPWKAEYVILPNRTRQFKDASVRANGITSAQEGTHADQLTIDDPVGLDDIDNTRNSNENMRKARNFLITADPALLISKRRSRIGFVGTRWAVDDVAEIPIANAVRFHGHQDSDFTTKPDGKWHVYYRLCIEQNSPVYPEDWSIDDFEELARADWWNFVTQYLNKPQASGLVELADYPLKRVSLDVVRGEHVLRYEDDPRLTTRLADCDLVLTIDPAGVERGHNAMKSRTSIGLWALDGYGRYSRLWGRVGANIDVVQMVDYIFEAHRTFPGLIRNTIIETNAMQQMILPVLRKEELRRNLSVRPKGIPAKGDKKARIRNALSLPLQQGKVYATDGQHTYMAFAEEKALFPSSDRLLDVLDESEKAFTALRRPPTEEERIEARLSDEDDWAIGELDEIYASNPVGY